MNRFLRHTIPVFAPEAGAGGAPAEAPAGASVDSGASPTPSPAPSSSGTPSQPQLSGDTGGEAAAGEGTADFEAIFAGPADPAEEAPSPAPEAPPKPAPKPQEAPPAPKPPPSPAEQKPAEAKPTDGAASPKETPAAPQVPTAEAPPLDPSDPHSILEYLQKNETEAIKHLAEGALKLSVEDVEAITDNAAEAIPNLMARAVVTAQKSTLMQIARMVPHMVHRHLESVKRNEAQEAKFYDRWKQLAKDKHGADVNSYAAVYRKMHPEATAEQVIEAIGPMVMMKHGITPQLATPQQPSGVPSPAVAQNGVRPPQSTPFVPAMGSGGGVSPSGGEDAPAWQAIFDHE